MIYSLNGILKEVSPNFIVVEAQGVGYGVKTTMTTISQLPPIEEKVLLYTHLYVREDAIELFGFATLAEKNCYKMLTTVNGVGPKAALSILSDNTPEQFALLVASGDAKSLTRSAGIGIKGAQRIVLELKDKISNEQIKDGIISAPVNHIAADKNHASEAINALMVLGFSQAEATTAITAQDTSASVEELIKLGLKALAGK